MIQAENSNGLLLCVFLDKMNGDSFDFFEKTLLSTQFLKFVNEVTFKTPFISIFEISDSEHFKGIYINIFYLNYCII